MKEASKEWELHPSDSRILGILDAHGEWKIHFSYFYPFSVAERSGFVAML